MKIKHVLPFLLSLVLLLIVSCQDKEAKNELNAFKQKEAIENNNIELARKSLKFLDTSDLDSVRLISTEDFKIYLNTKEKPMYIDDFKPMHKMFYSAFPDYSHKIINIFASGDYVIAQVLLSGTQKNEFLGIAPTNNKIEYKGIQILKFEEGKLAEVHVVDDDLTMMTQLGL